MCCFSLKLAFVEQSHLTELANVQMSFTMEEIHQGGYTSSCMGICEWKIALYLEAWLQVDGCDLEDFPLKHWARCASRFYKSITTVSKKNEFQILAQSQLELLETFSSNIQLGKACSWNILPVLQRRCTLGLLCPRRLWKKVMKKKKTRKKENWLLLFKETDTESSNRVTVISGCLELISVELIGAFWTAVPKCRSVENGWLLGTKWCVPVCARKEQSQRLS